MPSRIGDQADSAEDKATQEGNTLNFVVVFLQFFFLIKELCM